MEDMEKAEVPQGVHTHSAEKLSHKQGKPGPAALAERTEAWLAVPEHQGLREGSSEQRMSEKRWVSPLLRESEQKESWEGWMDLGRVKVARLNTGRYSPLDDRSQTPH